MLLSRWTPLPQKAVAKQQTGENRLVDIEDWRDALLTPLCLLNCSRSRPEVLPTNADR